MTSQQIATEALKNATQNQSLMNYTAIYEGFVAKGLLEADIKPRENVFTFAAWKALNRVVRRGEHGVKVVTWVQMTKTDKATGEKIGYKVPRSTTVFHLTQTDVLTS